MDEQTDSLAEVQVAGLRVTVDREVHMAALRYFDSRGAFASLVQAVIGIELPGALQACLGVAEGTILAWRSPTETLLVGSSGAALTQLQAQLAPTSDGCAVDLTGGVWAVRCSGEQVSELFARLGGSASLPQPGQARRSRLAEVPVLALQASAGETLLMVERVYAAHLMQWIRVTAADLGIA